MESKQKRKLIRRLARGVILGLTCAGGVVLGIYLSRIQIARSFVEKALAETDVVESRFDWDRLETDVCSLSGVFIKSGSYTLAVEQLDVTYDLNDIWKNRELKTLKLKGVQLYYDLTGPSTVNLQEVDDLIKSGIPFPIYSVTIENSIVTLLTDLGETSIDLDLELRKEGLSGIQGEVRASTETETIDLEIAISDRIRGSIQATLLDLGRTLSANGIEWKDTLPFTHKDALNLSTGDIEANVVFNGIALESGSVSTHLGAISIRDFDFEVDVENVQTSFELFGSEIRNVESRIHLKQFEMDPIIVYETTIQTASSDLKKIHVSIPDTRWESTNGERGIFSVNAMPVLEENYSIESYSGELLIKELQSESFNMSPFEISLEGTLESVSVWFGDLVSQTMPWLTLKELETKINGLDSETPEIEITSQVIANELPNSDLQGPLSGAWKLDANLSPGFIPQKVSLTLTSEENAPIVSAALATLHGAATLQADIDYWPEDRNAALKLGVTATDLTTKYEDWSIQGGAASITLKTEPMDLIRLGDLLNNESALIEFVAPLTEYEFNLQGSEFKGPSELTVQWFSAGFRSLDPIETKPIQSRLELGAGIVQYGPEVINQFSSNSDIIGNYEYLDTNTRATLLFENEPVSIVIEQPFHFSSPNTASEGKYGIEGINLVSSDLLSRHIPELKDSSVSAKIEIHGETEKIDNQWDASMNFRLRDGALRLPSQELSVHSIQADINLPSLINLSTDPSQSITADRITIGDIEATQVKSEFMITEGSEISIEKAGLSIFDGSVELDPFTLSIEDPNADLLLHFNHLSITPAIAMLDFFDGHVSGRLNGTLPIGIKNGYPVLGEGFLELDPSESAQFSYNATGFFTDQGLEPQVKKTLGDKLLERLGLEPNALLEDALGNLSIQTLRLDLFNKNLPQTPMRIQLAGVADTGQAQIPLNITTNVNGTVAELLNFLTRLDSLGLVAGQESTHSGTSDSNNL